MSSDPDSCIPGPLKDFVFDLHDSVRNSQIPSEQTALYTGTFRDLTAKYFAQGPWPSPHSISNECGGDDLFLALYKELTQRHLHSISRPTVNDRIDGWHVYRSLFDLLLAEASPEEGAGSGTEGRKDDTLFILPDWAFDILHEFVYQFQGFCQFRMNTYSTAAKYAPVLEDPSSSSSTSEVANTSTSTSNTTKKQPPAHIIQAIEALSKNRDAWAVETVLFYLHRLVTVGKESSAPAFKYLGLFASVTLARLECLLGDYTASLAALTPVLNAETKIAPPRGADDDVTPTSAEELVSSVFAARLSMAYHAGVSYLMLRRYKDATKILGTICFYMQRGFKTGQLKKLPGSDQFPKLYDRMIALLAILTHICTVPNLLEDSVAQSVRDKHGNQLSKIEAGEEGYEDLFIFACPKFVSPAVPDYSTALQPGAASAHSNQDAYKLQVKHFMNEMASQQTMRKLRSYMKLYTSISVHKLERLVLEDQLLPLLLAYKQKMQQTETGNESHIAPLDGKDVSALDVHYFITDDIVHIEEAEKENRFENYFMSQIAQNNDILKDVEDIQVKI
mmetsp:Transcript_5333/g.7771  ORF Transcript_5333/g.7771 Transcript_5333/m.7771 type:complete len:562 (+) Transcript_5333:230-1915(+)|eukprot:CAMPEP_0184856338 /NCGR_PEP_ID=MMETSP0580-20130426/1525_1 /TAXON_ID=1118495 /ORGANISM="Dactyliosolen fragilissimus" /LENGTH=561 /DNA_ID=CAMNT_0027351317 /DNA_START=205 /DNA_END=1890 /DNA_ORIENTATION=-